MPHTKPFNSHAIFALVLLVLNTVYASQIPELGMPFGRGGEPGAAFLPVILCGFVYIAALRILFMEMRRAPDEVVAELDAGSPHVRRIGLVGPLVVVALTVVFVAAFPYAGYAVSAGVYTFAIALYFNYEELGRWGRALIYSALTAAAITVFGWLFFVRLFDLFLPGWSF
ncbi:hypothetical protein ATO2_13860 [Roseovarius sp. 22II1-1F6A]|nr:hypothetical protein ATO2_13860 [Roseovarius sp. 22II1-1F6A]